MNETYKKLLDFKSKYSSTISWRLKSHSKVIEKHLNPGETVNFVFAAQKGFSSFDIFSTFVVVLTNKRIILAQKRVLWGYFYTTITPDMFNDLSISAGLIWGRVVIDTAKEVVHISNIDKTALDEIETAITSYMMEEKKKYKERKTELDK